MMDREILFEFIVEKPAIVLIEVWRTVIPGISWSFPLVEMGRKRIGNMIVRIQRQAFMS
jgi:hypothetical protein